MTKSIIFLRRDFSRAYRGRKMRKSTQNKPLVNSMGSSRLNVNSESSWVISIVFNIMALYWRLVNNNAGSATDALARGL